MAFQGCHGAKYRGQTLMIMHLATIGHPPRNHSKINKMAFPAKIFFACGALKGALPRGPCRTPQNRLPWPSPSYPSPRTRRRNPGDPKRDGGGGSAGPPPCAAFQTLCESAVGDGSHMCASPNVPAHQRTERTSTPLGKTADIYYLEFLRLSGWLVVCVKKNLESEQSAAKHVHGP